MILSSAAFFIFLPVFLLVQTPFRFLPSLCPVSSYHQHHHYYYYYVVTKVMKSYAKNGRARFSKASYICTNS